MRVAHGDCAGLLRKHGYTEIRKVGEGSFGKAVLVRTEDNGQLIAKMVDVSKASRKEMEDAVKEGKLLAELRHPYIVRYRESFTENGWLVIMMDYCEGGDLTAKITAAKKSRTSISEDQILRWFAQGILSLKYIHEKHILHRDLKPSNFFLSKNGSMKMGDFGIAKVLSCTIAVAKTQIGTPYYLSPELCMEKPYTWPSDIWAMGCILYELCALKVPFDAPNIPGLVQKIVKAPIPPVPSTYSSFVRDLVNEMLNRNPDKRPSPDDILQMPKMQSIVKQLLGEAQDQQSAADVSALQAPIRASSPLNSARANGGGGGVASHLQGPYADSAGSYKMHDLIEYWSASHSDWLPATVTKVDGEGRITIDLKPNTYISKEDQANKVRPRARSAAVAGGDRPGSRAASPRRSPSVGGGFPSVPSAAALPPRAGASPLMGRSPSVGGAFGGGPGSRPGSRAGSPVPVRRSLAGAAGAQMAGIGSKPGSRAASPRPGSGFQEAPSLYRKGDLVDYWSVSHHEWLPASITNSDSDGRIIIDLKPNTWITRDEQGLKVRPRGGVARVVSSGSRAPSVGASPQMRRNPSVDRFGARAASPRREDSRGRAMSPSGRAASPWGGRGASRDPPPVRAASPRRNADAPTPRRPPGMLPPSGGPGGYGGPLMAGGRNIAGY
mmetsp:Transcript_43743/g.70910  ORF Transcript_43743/g.70910 Transcript_43743/m.70910 type:complete len:666 (+) Transcript_43743:124-2121(+)